jgi:hypothetical protein
LINIRILASDYGDKTMQMSVQEFKQIWDEKFDKKGWAIFESDTTVPLEEQVVTHGVKSSDIQDGQSYTLVPSLMGG